MKVSKKTIIRFGSVSTAIICVTTGFYIAFSKEFISFDLIAIIVGIIALAAAVLSIIGYLEKPVENQNKRTELLLKQTEDQWDIQRELFQQRIIESEERIKQINSGLVGAERIRFNDGEREDILASIKQSVSQSLTQDLYINIESELRKAIIDAKSSIPTLLANQLDEARDRLEDEVDSLTKRANINLAFGTMLSVAALGILMYYIAHQEYSGDVAIILLQFLPRVSVVIFVELFAFFFLRIYKSSISEIKYYQNEITNIEFKKVAVYAAFYSGDASNLTNVISSLSNAERNFKLAKDESTVELEKSKHDTRSQADIFNGMVAILNRGKA